MDKIEEEQAKARVQEALWEWIQRAVVLGVAFGFGFFTAWVMFGAGVNGAPALRTLKAEQQAHITELKNKQVDVSGRLEVASGRLTGCAKDKQKCLTERAECRQTLIKAGLAE